MPDTPETVEVSGGADIYVEITNAAPEINVTLRDESPVIGVEVDRSGPPGQGVPTGGEGLQFLKKSGDGDYQTEWDFPGICIEGTLEEDATTYINVADVGIDLLVLKNAFEHGMPIYLNVSEYGRFPLVRVYYSFSIQTGMRYFMYFAGPRQNPKDFSLISFSLTTTSPSSMYGNLVEWEDRSEYALQDIGNLQNLETTAKSSLVAAINELVQGGGGTSDYNDLSNKPQIGGVTLSGNKSVEQLGLGTYSKPSGGIPATDLASAVQTSLGKADSALQSYTETDPTVPSWAKASSKPSYTKSEVGLGNVDNTSDANKPVSTAQQTALNAKADKVTEVTVSTAGAVTQALDAGKIYHFTGALASLTITLNAAASGQIAQYHFDFESGSTSPTVTIPNAVTMPSGFQVEASKHYEIDILNGYGAAMVW